MVSTLILFFGLALVTEVVAVNNPHPKPDVMWEYYGNAIEGTRYSPLADINKTSVRSLGLNWEWHFPWDDAIVGMQKDTPLVVPTKAGKAVVVICTPQNVIHALDAYFGTLVWTQEKYKDYIKGLGSCRGLAYWENPEKNIGDPCKKVIFMGTMDLKLAALDVIDGSPCLDFGTGNSGYVELFNPPLPQSLAQYVSITAPPLVINGIVATGCAMEDYVLEDMPRGRVWGFDTYTGKLIWEFFIIPEEVSDYGYSTWWNGTKDVGAANVWGAMSGDPELNSIFLGTSSPSVDTYGGNRFGPNKPSDSIVALDATTGKMKWAFQTVHHDLWDYDIGAQPTVSTVNGTKVVVVGTKVGFIFVLNAVTGQPVFGVDERPAPKSDVPGEWTSQTQPWPRDAAFRMSNLYTLNETTVWGPHQEEVDSCVDLLALLGGRQGGDIFTPPSINGSVVFPGTAGGINWGSCAIHPESQTLVCIVQNNALATTLYPRDEQPPKWCSWRYEQKGTPYHFCYTILRSQIGFPCVPPPWTKIVAVNITNAQPLWSQPLGYHPVAGYDKAWGSGSQSGGPIVTGGGLIFAAGTEDANLHVIDVYTGKLLSDIPLSRKSLGTPITYRVNDTQFVVVVAVENGMGSAKAYSVF